MSVPCKADTHTGSGSANDSTLLAIRRMGVDILGPFPRAVGGYHFLFVAIDKFTKWLEVTPVVSITQGVAVAFLKSIVCRFGVPSRIITDNGTQFKSRLFQEYCEGIDTQLCFASVAHPRSNGQAERANTEILRGLKTHTYDCLKAWCKLGQRASVDTMGEPDHTQPSYRGDPVLPGLRGRSLPSPRNSYGLPTSPIFR
jgi:transposase InsO family protein